MTGTVQPPPVKDVLVDAEAKPSISWLIFFNSLYEGDIGTDWTPTFTSLTEVGTATKTGKYILVGRRLCYFVVKITPSTSTSATSGTTYIDNFPLTFASDGLCAALQTSGAIGAAIGAIQAANNRIYVPSWSAIAFPITICGFCEVVPA